MSRVFVLGNASIDVTLRVPRLPLPGETLMADGIARMPGGKGLNQAVVAARAGAEVHFCAPLGSEPETALIRDALAAEPLSALLPDPGQPTDLSTLLVAPDGENCIVSTGACCEALSQDDAAAFLAGMRDEDILLLQGNLSASLSLAAVRRAKRAIFNTAPIRWPVAAVAAHCEFVIANRVEAMAITGQGDPTRAASHLGGRIGIVTLGEEGCIVAGGDGVVAYPAAPIRAVDTTGAGDTFCGMLAACLAAGRPLRAAVTAAQHAAALAVGRAGCFTALPNAAELAQILETA